VLSLIYRLHKSLGHTKSSQSSLVASWQRIYNSLTVTAAYIKSSLHRLTFNWQLNWTDFDWTVSYCWHLFIQPRVGPQHRKHICCVAIDTYEPHRKYLLRRRFYCCVRVLQVLPRNVSTCHSTIIWIVTTWSPVEVFRRFAGTYCSIFRV
jgi:hypothetical protein